MYKFDHNKPAPAQITAGLYVLTAQVQAAKNPDNVAVLADVAGPILDSLPRSHFGQNPRVVLDAVTGASRDSLTAPKQFVATAPVNEGLVTKPLSEMQPYKPRGSASMAIIPGKDGPNFN